MTPTMRLHFPEHISLTIRLSVRSHSILHAFKQDAAAAGSGKAASTDSATVNTTNVGFMVFVEIRWYVGAIATAFIQTNGYDDIVLEANNSRSICKRQQGEEQEGGLLEDILLKLHSAIHHNRTQAIIITLKRARMKKTKMC